MRRWSVQACLLAALVVSACGTPPHKEMDQALGAINAARAVGAEVAIAGDPKGHSTRDLIAQIAGRFR